MSAHDLIDAYIHHLRLTGRSPYTTYEWGLLLRRADRELEYGLDEAGDLELLTWLARDDWSPATRSAYDACLRSFYRFAITEQCPDPLRVDPMVTIPAPRKDRSLPRPCTDEHLAVIIDNAREPYYTWCVLAAFGALRCIEVSRLDREHVTEQSMRLHGKGGKRRVVPTHELVWDAVRRLPPGPVARDRAGQRIHARYISRNVLAYLRDGLGLPRGVTMHPLRHWCLTNIQRETGNIRITQEIAGHSSPATTAVYTLVDDEQRTAAIRGLQRPNVNGDRSGAAAAGAGDLGVAPHPLPPGVASGPGPACSGTV